MPKYNLENLGHEEFETLCQSLVQQIIGPGAKIYGMGRDGAREATFIGKANYPSTEEQWDGNWIIQSKFHDLKQGVKECRNQILTDLDSELTKIISYGHKCENYILITNVPLSGVFQKGTKDKIDAEIIPKYNIKNVHVWGADEVCRFLDSYPGIRQSYASFIVPGDLIASVMGIINAKETNLDQIVELYCRGCFNSEKYAKLDDTGDLEDKKIDIRQVFIDLNVTQVKPSQCPQIVIDKLPNWFKEALNNPERTSALSYLLDDTIPRLVLVGGPGEGKSTLLQYLAQVHRARIINELSGFEDSSELEKCRTRIPFRVILKEYAQWISSNDINNLFEYLAIKLTQDSGQKVSSDQVQQIIKKSPILLLLDGLDEVPNKEVRENILNNINSFIDQIINVFECDLKIVATTRPQGYSNEFDPLHYIHLTLKGIPPKKAINYAKLWTNARNLGPVEIKRILNTFKECLKDNVVTVLTKTPLQVTILLFIIYSGGTLPKQREELFDKYVDTIYMREYKKLPEVLKTEKDQIYDLHKYLAFLLHRRAEKNESEALMDISEFKEQIKQYLKNKNELLTEEEIDSTSNQIIDVSKKRLVLIESPQEGKVGFALTTIREFFAASYLVDQVESTEKRISRFKTISKSPHWANVTLFFAGRVGRIMPGESSNIISICQEIDLKGVDKFLKRGALLTMKLVDDRAFRDSHSMIAGIEYGMTLFENKFLFPTHNDESFPFNLILNFIYSTENLIEQFKNLPEIYKERVIKGKLEDRFELMVPEKLSFFIEVYSALFGPTKNLKKAIKKISESNSPDIKIWALNKAVQHEIHEKWVLNLFEDFDSYISSKKSFFGYLNTFNVFNSFQLSHLYNYLNYPLSDKIKSLIINILLEIVVYGPFGEELSSLEFPTPSLKENDVFFRSINLLLKIYSIQQKKILKVPYFPILMDPKIKKLLEENNLLIKKFCESFSSSKDELIYSISTIYEFLLDHSNFNKYKKMIGIIRNNKNLIYLKSLLITFGLYEKGDLHRFHENLSLAYNLYNNEKNFKKDIEELNDIIYKKSENVNKHSLKFIFWIKSGFDPYYTKFLDQKIIKKFNKWFEDLGISKKIFNAPVHPEYGDSELNLLFINIAENKLKNNEKIKNIGKISFENKKTDKKVVKRLKELFEKVLDNYSHIQDPNLVFLSNLYISSLEANIVKKEHMQKLYQIFSKSPKNNILPLFPPENENIYSFLDSMLESNDEKVIKLATATLSCLSPKFNSKEELISRNLWKYAVEEESPWHLSLLRGISRYKLNWSFKKEYILEKLKSRDEDFIEWCNVIIRAGYWDDNDREALFSLICEVLSKEEFNMESKKACFIRLMRLANESKPIKFEETILNLV